MNIQKIAEGANVAGLYWTLQQHPELWNQHSHRTDSPNSPHHGLDDIWLRFGDEEHVLDGQPHEAHWYPAADILGVKPLIYELFANVQGDSLGGVLITRIPAGASCKPHTDPGWHAIHYRDKYAIQITSAPGQRFCFESESLETKPGDVFLFNNQCLHWVENPTNYERITLIVCVRKGD